MAEKKPKSHLTGFVAKVVSDPAAPPATLLLRGYLGASSEKGHTRVYFDPQLGDYVEVPDAAILHAEAPPAGASPLAPTYLWIDRDAELVHGPATGERRKARFLEGRIQRERAGGGPGITQSPGTNCCWMAPTLACAGAAQPAAAATDLAPTGCCTGPPQPPVGAGMPYTVVAYDTDANVTGCCTGPPFAAPARATQPPATACCLPHHTAPATACCLPHHTAPATACCAAAAFPPHHTAPATACCPPHTAPATACCAAAFPRPAGATDAPATPCCSVLCAAPPAAAAATDERATACCTGVPQALPTVQWCGPGAFPRPAGATDLAITGCCGTYPVTAPVTACCATAWPWC